MILVLCYPSHTTHVLQGLDVVIFAILKRYLSDERDRWERETGEKISKQNFLGIYGRAHLRAMTPANIKSAFAKTGVWPFNRAVITKDMMAPAKETSCEGHLPIIPETPVRVIAKLLRDLTVKDKVLEEDETELSLDLGDRGDEWESEGNQAAESGDQELTDAINFTRASSPRTQPNTNSILLPIDPAIAIKNAVKSLSETALAHLISAEPMSSAASMPHHASAPIPLATTSTLQIEPKTKVEVALLAALREAEMREASLQRRVLELQATNILNEAYCSKLRGQLARKEEKVEQKGKGKLMGSGLPCLLSGDWFYERVVEFEAWQKREEHDKEARQQARTDRASALEEWRSQEEERKRQNAARREEWEEEKRLWEQERSVAKTAKQRFNKKKPTLGKLLPAIPKPRVHVLELESSEEDGPDDEERESDNE